jgi:PAS domain S-box-containing protein
MEVDSQIKQVKTLHATEVMSALLDELSAVSDYRALRDSLPGRLASLLRCRCILIYQRVGETLQFASGSFDDKPGWSASLLAVAHINPIPLSSDILEAQAWRARTAITAPAGSDKPKLVAVPLLYRQRGIGVLVALRGEYTGETQPLVISHTSPTPELAEWWEPDEVQLVELATGIAAMCLENTRLLERDRERIHELSLLNSISRQLHSSLHELERVRAIVIQRTREISGAEHCECILPSTKPGSIAWISPDLHVMLMHHLEMQREGKAPFIIERSGNATPGEFVRLLEPHVKTFFAVPLFRGSARYVVPTSARESKSVLEREHSSSTSRLLGIVVGAYTHPWKMRREEMVLLQVLASQASVVFENIILMEDVVEARNEARKLLRQVLEDQRFKALVLESIPSGLITINLNGQVTTFNRAAQAILGYHPMEVLGQPVQRVLESPLFKLALESGQPQQETRASVNRNGQEVVLDMLLSPLRDDKGQLVGILITFTDVTDMHRLEEEKRRLDRLATLGELAASVAHEVRNPLASIKTSMQMLLDDLRGVELTGKLQTGVIQQYYAEGDIQDSVSVVLKEVERLDSIVRDLLLFSKPRHLHLSECDVVVLCDRALHLIEAQCRDAGVIIHRVYHTVPPVCIDMGQMEQVFINLLLNALHAMPDGGILTVSCQVVRGRVEPEQPTGAFYRGPGSLLFAETSDNEQSWLEIAVSDTGTGIAPQQLEHIFQPFYTTKAHGIGLGLPISRRIVEDHHGMMLVESQPGYGATFIVRLPLTGEDVISG